MLAKAGKWGHGERVYATKSQEVRWVGIRKQVKFVE